MDEDMSPSSLDRVMHILGEKFVEEVGIELDVGKGVHRCVDGGIFRRDGQLCDCLSSALLFGVGKEGGNSMGLILEARSPFFSFYFHEPESWVFRCFELCFVVRTEAKGGKMCPIKRARLHSKLCSMMIQYT